MVENFHILIKFPQTVSALLHLFSCLQSKLRSKVSIFFNFAKDIKLTKSHSNFRVLYHIKESSESLLLKIYIIDMDMPDIHKL